MIKQWKVWERVPDEIVEKLKDFDPLVRQMLFRRGIKEAEAAVQFLKTPYEGQHSPFLFLNMAKAVARIWQAVEAGEKITVYGDYDADAVTAAAVLMRVLKALGGQVESYIPDRFTEGYGVNLQAIEKLATEGTRLIITVDCGTNSCDAAELCTQLGVDLVITDHHEVVGELPRALALVNPKNPKETYPYRELTGVGVAFKLAQALLTDSRAQNRNPKITPGWEKWLLDLVAIGTVADCHSLLGENRILVKYGLKVLAKTRWPGLKALCAVAGLNFSRTLPDAYTLGFMLAPRLNAAGRLEHASVALDLLLEDDAVAAQQRAQALNLINQRRQTLTLTVQSEAREQALQHRHRPVLLLHKSGWPKGVVGLVAGRLAEEFQKPVIVLERGERESTGSARTAGSFNLIKALKPAAALLTKFGGHSQAAGLTVPNQNLEAFYRVLLEEVDKQSPITENSNLFLEAELKETDLNFATLDKIAEFEPFGIGNPRPKFLFSHLEVLSIRNVGALGQHVQLRLRLGNTEVSSIAFNASEVVKKLKVGEIVDVAAELLREDWNGEKLKLKLVDLKINSDKNEKRNYPY